MSFAPHRFLSSLSSLPFVLFCFVSSLRIRYSFSSGKFHAFLHSSTSACFDCFRFSSYSSLLLFADSNMFINFRPILFEKRKIVFFMYSIIWFFPFVVHSSACVVLFWNSDDANIQIHSLWFFLVMKNNRLELASDKEKKTLFLGFTCYSRVL